MNEKLVPTIAEMMDIGYDEAICLVASFEQTLQPLIDGGSLGQKTLDVISLGKSKERTNGRAWNVSIRKVTFGPRMTCLEFEAHDVSFGSLHFAAIDMVGGSKDQSPRATRTWVRECGGRQSMCAQTCGHGAGMVRK